MALVELTIEHAAATITLSRPPGNALNAELIAAIDAAVAECEDEAVRAVVITGEPHFAFGADITGFQAAFETGAQDRQSAGLASVVSRFEALAKPTIAAVRGVALGGGLELAMGADLRFFGDDARVGQPEIRLGLIPGAGGTQRLPRIVGYQRARELCLTGRHVFAEEALTMGLADAVFPADELLAETTQRAAEFAAGPTAAYAAAKRAIAGGWGRPIEEGLAVEAEQFAIAFATEDAKAGVAAFLAKERPEFSGR
jgi:enoyl-CoA hydratase